MKNIGTVRTVAEMVAALALAAILPVCSTLAPSSKGGDNSSINISLASMAGDSIFYYGGIDTVEVTFANPVTCDFANTIHFIHGTSQYHTPVEEIGRQVTSIKFPICWASRPVNSDTAGRAVNGVRYYDSLYIVANGQTSNLVKVYVINIAPVIDSIRISGKSSSKVYPIGQWANSDTQYTFIVDTSSAAETLKVWAHDFYGTGVCTWQSQYYPSNLQQTSTPTSYPNAAMYANPSALFQDRVVVNVADGHGGAMTENLLLIKGVTVPVIDSTTVTDTASSNDTIYFDDGTSNYNTFAFTSAEFIAYSHTSNVTGVWTALNGTVTVDQTVTGTQSGFAVRYVTSQSGAADSLKTETTQVIDTLTFTLTDRLNQTTVRKICILKVPKNKPAVIDSMSVDTEMFYKADNSWVYTITDTTVTSIPLKVFAHDPDGSAKNTNCSFLKLTGHTLIGSFSSDTGWTSKYNVYPDSAYSDTFNVQVADSMSFLTKRSVIVTIVR